MAAGIAVLSLLPNSKLPEISLSDKIEHIMAYVVLAFWFGSIVVRRDYLWIALSLLGFGAVIELAQGWMSQGRTADIMDLRADAIGIVLGLVLALTPAGRWARWLEALFRKAIP
jgi:VanZ family protein